MHLATTREEIVQNSLSRMIPPRSREAYRAWQVGQGPRYSQFWRHEQIGNRKWHLQLQCIREELG